MSDTPSSFVCRNCGEDGHASCNRPPEAIIAALRAERDRLEAERDRYRGLLSYWLAMALDEGLTWSLLAETRAALATPSAAPGPAPEAPRVCPACRHRVEDCNGLGACTPSEGKR